MMKNKKYHLTHSTLIAALLACTPLHAKGADPTLKPKDIIEPVAGVDKVKPMKPDWCAQYQGTLKSVSSPVRTAQTNLRRGYSLKGLQHIAWAACDAPDDSTRQEWVANWRQGWINLVGWTEAQDRAAMKLWVLDRAPAKKIEEEFCAAHKPEKEARPDKRRLQKALYQAVGCQKMPIHIKGGGYDTKDLGWWLDQSAAMPSELMRANYVLECLNYQKKKEKKKLGAYALCGPDARRLNPEKFEKELGEMKLGLYGETMARMTFAYAVTVHKRLAAEFEKLSKKKAAYKKLLFEIPEQGFTNWEKLYGEHKQAVDYAFSIEEMHLEGSKKAFAGCGSKMRQYYADYVGKKKPKSADDVKAIANDQIGYLLGRALTICDAWEERYFMAATTHNQIKHARVWRGPRTAAYYAAIEHLTDILEDQSSFPTKVSAFGAPVPDATDSNMLNEAYEKTFNKISWGEAEEGRVKNVKKQKGGVLVSFRTQSWKAPILKCKESNKIDRIDSSGKIIYRSVCKVTGSKVMKSTPKPVWIPAALAKGIRPGVMLITSIDSKPKPRHAFPLEVYKSQKKKHMLAYYGIVLK